MTDASIHAAEYSITAASINEAKKIFKSATNRLLSIGEWNRWCNGLSAIFKLSDQTGRTLNRKARPHDFFCIGDDNVLEVSRLATFKKASGKAESMAIEVKPPSDSSSDGVGLFEIKRYNNVVTAIVHEPARPEVSNKISFVKPIEWSSLVRRLLSGQLD